MADDDGYAMFGDKGFKETKHFKLSLGAGDVLEPFYYRVLYGLRNNRFYRTVKKVYDYYNISPNTQQFGFSSNNLRQEISSASGLLGQVGQVVKSIVGMKKDKQRIDECLEYYDDNGKPNEIVLKGLWADFIDSKTGPASLTQAAQKLEFFVARDWFFKVNSLKEIDKLEDVPGNVKTFLTKKYNEYTKWKKHWKPRLEDMQRILNQQVNASKQTVNLYKQWIQPLLRNVEALKMAPELNNPDLIKISGNTFSKVKVVSWGKVDPKKSYQKVFDYIPHKDAKSKPIGERGKCLFAGKDVPFMPVLEFEFTLRKGEKGYTETLIDFSAKLYDKKKFEEMYWDAWTKDPAEEWIENLMLQEALPIDLETKKEEKKESKPLMDIISARVDETFASFAKIRDKLTFKSGKKTLSKFDIDKLAGKAGKTLASDLGVIYFVIKKSFGMLAEFIMYR